MSVFYDHLTSLDELHQELLELNLPTKEHYNLVNLIDSTLHHEVLTICLDCLPMEHHENFILHFNQEPSDQEILVYLKQLDPEIENKIATRSTEVREKIKKHLKEVKN